MKNDSKLYRVWAVAMLVCFFSLSCARQAPVKLPQAKPQTEAETDDALKALPEEGTTEAGKLLEKLKGESTAEETYRELRKREQEDDERRMQRAITEDRIVSES